MTNTNNLLPCPFCGGEPKYEVWSDRNYHKAECVDCAFEFDYCQTYEELEASWNKRIAPAPCLHQIQEPAPVQADARDAERYRWLRARDLETISQGGVFAGMTPQNVILNEEDLDQAIDAAIAAAKG